MEKQSGKGLKMIFESAMDKKEKRDYKKIRTIAAQFLDEYDGSQKRSHISIDLGICKDCDYLEYAESRWGKYFAKCNYLELRLNSSDPIEKCNKHKPVGKMELGEMYTIHIPIEVNKTPAGFTSKEK